MLDDGLGLEIMDLVNRFDFCTVDSIADILHLNKVSAYRKIKKLADENFLTYEYKLHGYPKIVQLTQKGHRRVETNLPVRKTINLNHFKHNMIVLQIAQFLHQQKHIYQTEREYKAAHRNDDRHPDLVTEIRQEKVFIEVELTSKNRKKLLALWDVYSAKSVRIIYVCNANIYFTYKELAYTEGFKIDFFKVDDWQESIFNIL